MEKSKLKRLDNNRLLNCVLYLLCFIVLDSCSSDYVESKNSLTTVITVKYDDEKQDSLITISYTPYYGIDSSITYLLFKKITNEGKIAYKLDYPKFLFEKNKLNISKRVVDSLVNQVGYVCIVEEHHFLVTTEMSNEETWNNYLESIGTENVVTEIDLVNLSL